MCPKPRRDLHEWAPTHLAAMVCVKGLLPWAKLASPCHSVRGWLTASAGASLIEVHPSQAFQSALGFGGILTASSQISAAMRREVLSELFSLDSLQFFLARASIGAGDYSRSTDTFAQNLPTGDLLETNVRI